MFDSKITQIIVEKADKYKISKQLIKAIILKESTANTFAIRFEPDYEWVFNIKYYAKKNHIPFATEENQQKTSWGLMQVMGAVARERGFEGKFLSELCVPEIGLEYGCKHLKKYYDKYGTWEKAIASYNYGHPKIINGKFANQNYVDDVLNNWKKEEKK